MFNEKILFKMLCFSDLERDYKDNLYDQKMVFEGKRLPTTKTECNLSENKRLYSNVKDLFENLENDLNRLNDIQSYSELLRVGKYYLDNKDEDDAYKVSSMVFLYVLRKNMFGKESIKYAIYCMNAILEIRLQLPIILYQRTIIEIDRLIEKNITASSLTMIMKELSKISMTYNTKFQDLSKEELLKLLKGCKTFLKEEYGVYSIELYGSYARGDYTNYSDIDLIVKSTSNNINYDGLKKHLQNMIKRRIDMIIDKGSLDKKLMSSDFFSNRQKVF